MQDVKANEAVSVPSHFAYEQMRGRQKIHVFGDVRAVMGAAFASWIEHERQARIMTAPTLEVLWLSVSARELLESEDVLTVQGGRLRGNCDGIERLLKVAAREAQPDKSRCHIALDDADHVWICWSRRLEDKGVEAVGMSLTRAGRPHEFSAMSEAHELTRSEGRIVELMLKGMETGRIAQKLNISIDTLRTHVKNTYRKLQVRSRGELFATALDFLQP